MAGPWKKYGSGAAQKPSDSQWSASAEADNIESVLRPGAFSDASGSILSGIPFGEEIVSSMAAIPQAGIEYMQGKGFHPARAYQRSRDTERELQRRREERSPVASTVGAVSGGLGLGGVAAKGGLTFLQGAKPTLGSLVGRGAGEGAAWGSLYGAGEGQGLMDRAEKAVSGAGVGALIGGTLGAVTRAFTKVPKTSKPTAKAYDMVNRAMDREGVKMGDVAGRLAAMGDDAMPADLGPAFREQVEGLAASPGNAQKVVRDALMGRSDAAGQRVTKAATKALGRQVDMVSTVDDIIKQRSAAAKPLYDHALKQPVPFTKELESLLKRPATASALNKAKTMAADEGIQSAQWFANVADNGTVTIKNVPDARQLHYTKMALDDKIDVAKRAGNNNSARIFTAIKDELLGMMDDAVPSYAQARKAYSGPSQIMDAMESGKGIFANKNTPGDIRKLVGGMSAGEKEAYQRGARAAISDVMGTARNDANAARAVFEKGYNQEKLRLLVGPEKADELIHSLGVEKIFMDTKNQALGNSRTASRQAIMRELGIDSGEAGPVRKAMNMNFGDAAADVGDKVARAFNKSGIEARNAELARILTERGGATFGQGMRPDLAGGKKAIMDALMRSAISSNPRSRLQGSGR